MHSRGPLGRVNTWRVCRTVELLRHHVILPAIFILNFTIDHCICHDERTRSLDTITLISTIRRLVDGKVIRYHTWAFALTNDCTRVTDVGNVHFGAFEDCRNCSGSSRITEVVVHVSVDGAVGLEIRVLNFP